jgi:putative ABC transport system permease protein
MTGTLVVGRQIEFIQTKNLGYNRHNVVSLILPEDSDSEKALVLKNELNKLTNVVSTSYAYYHITGVPYFKFDYEVEINNTMKTMLLAEVFVDYDYLQTMGIKLLEGRNFDINNPSDSTKAFIINETAAKGFGWINPLGKRIRLKQSDSDSKKWDGTVIGVVKDFNTRSLHDRIEPLVMRLPFEKWPGYCLNIRTNGEIDDAIPLIKSTFEKAMPGFLADIRIVEDMFNDQYREEHKIFSALEVCTWIIVFISVLGIFSLSLYMSLRRMKEFGIRKVLGATSLQITFLHASSFIKLALIANGISLPIAYWLANQWLEQFAFRTVVDGLIFLTVTVITIILVLISAGYSSIRAGKMNPVDVIKGTN